MTERSVDSSRSGQGACLRRRIRPRPSALRRWAVLGYGLLGYAGFLAVFLYLIGFVTGLWVPRCIAGPEESGGSALTIDVLLLVGFALQHSVMARPGFKRVWTRWVPPPIERSTYVQVSNLYFVLLFWQWRPLPDPVWQAHSPSLWIALQSLQICGWLLVVISTALINHGDLFGLRQVCLYWRGRRYFPPNFVTPGPYNIIRHPLYLGWLLAFWAAPTMTAGHLLFAGFMLLYVLVAIRFEERDLMAEHGVKYRRYSLRVPRLLPFSRATR